MTFEDIKRMTNRFNDIKRTQQPLKNKRFEMMLNDIVLLFPKSDKFAARMYASICEEMEV